MADFRRVLATLLTSKAVFRTLPLFSAILVARAFPWWQLRAAELFLLASGQVYSTETFRESVKMVNFLNNLSMCFMKARKLCWIY